MRKTITIVYTVRRQTNTLPAFNWGSWEYLGVHSCSPTGEMADGTMIWTDKDENDFFKTKVGKRYIFVRM